MKTLRANDWSALVPDEGTWWTPNQRVSICIPAHAPRHLERVLDAIEAQTYPQHLIEVVVADDGSEPAIAFPHQRPVSVSVVRLEKTSSFGASRARNAAAAVAQGDLLIFLDADVVPERHVVACYARWFIERNDPLVLGLCRFVESQRFSDAEFLNLVQTDGIAGAFANDRVDDQEWRENTFGRTNDLRVEARDAFRVVVGATLALSADQFRVVGGFRELGVRGVEDTEFGYRVHANGAPLILDRDAVHWHQGRRTMTDDRKAAIIEARRPYVESLIPIRGFRPQTWLPSPSNVTTVVPRAVVWGSSGCFHGRPPIDVFVLPEGAALEANDPQPILPYMQAWVPDGAAIDLLMVDRALRLFDETNVGMITVRTDAEQPILMARTRALRRASHSWANRRPTDEVQQSISNDFGDLIIELDELVGITAGRSSTGA